MGVLILSQKTKFGQHFKTALMKHPKPQTDCITVGRTAPLGGQAKTANVPIYQTSTILFDTFQELDQASKIYHSGQESYTYGRKGTPTSLALCEALATLEGGHAAYIAPSGLASVSTALLSQVGAGDHILVTDNVYAPTRHLCDGLLARMGVRTTYYDPLIGADIRDLIEPNTKVIYMESPGSLTLEVQDVPAICKEATERNVVTMIDNTWASPLFFKPFSHGVDIVIQAVTKYLGGHSDVMMGAVIANEKTYRSVRAGTHDLGQFAGSIDIAMVLRGLRTLSVRLKEHEKNALVIAQWFEQQPQVARVHHPALASHPQHALWKRDFLGSSGLFSVEFKPDYHPDALNAMVENYQYFGIGFSWGGFESLALPVHPDYLRQIRSHAHTHNSLIRYHMGLEHTDDLLADLANGLNSLTL